jgi:N-acetylneuraminic acid mutarotase
MKNVITSFTITLIFVCAFPITLSADWNWHKRTYLVNCKRDQACAFSIGNKGYLCCGSDTNNITLNDLWEYNASNDTWTQKANLMGPPRRSPFSFSLNGLGYVGGGIADSNTTGALFGDFYAYDQTSNTWIPKASYSATGGSIYRAAATACNGKGYLIGGRNNWTNNSLVREYDPSTNTWTTKASFPGVPTSSGGRDGGAAFVANNKVYFGTGRDDSFFTKDFWEFDPSTNVWTRKKDFPGSGRFSGIGFNLKNIGFIGLGTDGGFLKDIYYYDANTDLWNFANNFDGAGRRNTCAFIIGDSAYVTTGKSAGGTKQDLNVMYNENIEPTSNEDSKIVAKINIYPSLLNETISQIRLEGHDESKSHIIDIYAADGTLMGRSILSAGNHNFTSELNHAGLYLVILDGVKIGSITKI